MKPSCLGLLFVFVFAPGSSALAADEPRFPIQGKECRPLKGKSGQPVANFLTCQFGGWNLILKGQSLQVGSFSGEPRVEVFPKSETEYMVKFSESKTKAGEISATVVSLPVATVHKCVLEKKVLRPSGCD